MAGCMCLCQYMRFFTLLKDDVQQPMKRKKLTNKKSGKTMPIEKHEPALPHTAHTHTHTTQPSSWRSF